MLDTATLALEVTANTFVNFLRKNFHITEEAAYGYICAKRRNNAYGNTNGKIDTAVKNYIYNKYKMNTLVFRPQFHFNNTKPDYDKRKWVTFINLIPQNIMMLCQNW